MNGRPSRLATYGSLRPGEQHHDLVADLDLIGAGSVRGSLADWQGYPMLTIDPVGELVPVVVLGGISDDKWIELDDFEGPAYRLDLVDVVLDDGRALVAGCYVAADSA
jgi:gamma-glutamylcyclotransferase (GGCT)/AIG2-like uncharacterized protein YtfP